MARPGTGKPRRGLNASETSLFEVRRAAKRPKSLPPNWLHELQSLGAKTLIMELLEDDLASKRVATSHYGPKA